jgi:transcriptional antiterminator RfaH
MAFWAVAQLQPQRQALALHLLEQKQFPVYAPRLRERRTVRGRREDIEAPLFPGYAFVAIELQWHAARWCPGVIRLVMDGLQPARVPDAVIEEIHGRERNGAVPSQASAPLR